jgi:hypothetical protein
VKQLRFESTTLTGVAGVFEFALSRRSKTSMPNVTDRDVILKYSQRVSFTTSGMAVFPLSWFFTPNPSGILIVEDPLYLVIDSASTSVTQTIYCAIDYELVSISEVDRLSLLAATLE